MKRKLFAMLLLICLLMSALSAGMSAQAQGVTVYVSSNTLKVYKSASTSAASLGTMAYGESMDCVTTNGDWAQVRNSSGATGYCKISGLSTTNPNNLSATFYVNKASTKVYKKPSTSSSVMMSLKLNASYTAVAVTPDGDWYRLKNGSHYGYVQAKYLSDSKTEDPDVKPTPVPAASTIPTPAPGPTATPKATEQASFTVYIAKNTLKVYKRASTSSTVMGTKSYGESITHISASGDWSLVRNSSNELGYCKTSGLTVTNPNTIDATAYINTANTKVYKRPETSSSVMMYLKLNSHYTVVAMTTDGAWLRLKNGNYYGYVQAKYASTEAAPTATPTTAASVTPTPGVTATPTIAPTATPQAQFSVYVAKNTLKVYKKASTSSTVLSTKSYGESMTHISTSGDWSLVRVSTNVQGYCKTSSLTVTDPNTIDATAYINTANTKVYKRPETSSSVMMYLKLNSHYTAVAMTTDGAWLRLKNGSYYGYAQAKYVSTEAAPTATPTAGVTATPAPDATATPTIAPTATVQPQFPVYVADKTLKVYKKASTSSSVLGTMAYGEEMTHISTDGDWTLVRNSSNEQGYCKTSGLTATNPNTLDTTVYINTSNTKVYKRPETSSGVMMYLKLNSHYTAVAMTSDGEWLRLKNGKYYGYVQAKYLSNAVIEDNKESTAYVISDTLKVYKSASSSSTELGTMAFGETLTLQSVTDSWAKVKNASGIVGYCSYGGISATNPNSYNLTVYVQSTSAKIYSKPLTSAEVVKTAARDDAFTLVAMSGGKTWARIKLSGTSYGYIAMSEIAETKYGSGIDITDVSAKTVYITATRLTFYTETSESSADLGTMSFGESVTLTGLGSTWARAKNAAGVVGFCKASGLAETNPNTKNTTLYAQIDGTKVYAGASTSTSVLNTLKASAQLSGVAVSSDNSWARVKNGSSYGYVTASSVATTPPGSSSTVNKLVTLAQAQMGKKYVYGTSGPNTFDCSGFTCYLYKQITGIKLERSAYAQGYDSTYPKISSIDDLKVGDIVCFNTNSSDSDLSDHTGLYIGGKKFIHCSSAAAKVITSDLGSGYYNRTFSWGRRIL